jgi:hypothetical protein
LPRGTSARIREIPAVANPTALAHYHGHYHGVVLRDAIAECLADGAFALACAAFSSRFVAALAADLNEAADLSNSLAAAITSAPTV